MKFLKSIFVAVLLSSIVALTASAQTPQSLSFINGANFQFLTLTTNVYNGTNVYTKGSTITNSATYPYTGGTSPTLVTNTAALQDVVLWANRDGTAPLANISATLSGLNAIFTNVVTFNFAVVPTGTGSAATDASHLFSFSVTGTGTNEMTIVTNIPISLLQGSRKIRCVSINSSLATAAPAGGTNGTISRLDFNGFKPN